MWRGFIALHFVGSTRIENPHSLLVTPVAEKHKSKLKELFKAYHYTAMSWLTDFDAVVSFASYDQAVQTQYALQCTPFEGTDLCVYFGVEGIELKEKYNAQCPTCLVRPVSGSVTTKGIIAMAVSVCWRLFQAGT